MRPSLWIGKQRWGWVVGRFLASWHLCRHLRCPARRALASAGSSSHWSQVHTKLSHNHPLDSWLARLDEWTQAETFWMGRWGAAVVAACCPWARAGRPRGSAGRAWQAALGPPRPRSTAGKSLTSQRRIHPPFEKTKLDVSTHDRPHCMGLHVTHIKARWFQKRRPIIKATRNLQCRKIRRHSNSALVAEPRNKQTIVSEPSPWSVVSVKVSQIQQLSVQS